MYRGRLESWEGLLFFLCLRDEYTYSVWEMEFQRLERVVV